MNLIQILPQYLLIDGILDDLKKFIADQLYKACEATLKGTDASLNSIFSSLSRDLQQSPQSYAAQAYSLIFNIQQSVVTPIAGLILTFIFCYEMIQLVQARNAMQDIGSWDIWKVILKTAAAIVFVTHAMEICMAFFDLVSYMINRSSGILSSPSIASPMAKILQVAKQYKDEINIGGLIAILLISQLARFVTLILYVVSLFVIISRMIEIYVTSALAPLMMGAIFNKEFNSMPINYLKNMFSLALQGFLMLIIVAIWGSLSLRIMQNSNDPWLVLGMYMVSGAVLCGMLIKSEKLAKAAIGMM